MRFRGTPNAPEKRANVSEGTRADCEAIESPLTRRTDECHLEGRVPRKRILPKHRRECNHRGGEGRCSVTWYGGFIHSPLQFPHNSFAKQKREGVLYGCCADGFAVTGEYFLLCGRARF